MALVTTPGAADANSYISLADADSYQSTRLHNADWTGASDGDKEAALQWATRRLDLEPWVASAVTGTQALRWPRSGAYTPDGFPVPEDTIPLSIVQANAELALILLGEDVTVTPAGGDLNSLKVDVIELDFKSKAAAPAMPANVQSLIAHYKTGNRMVSQVLRT